MSGLSAHGSIVKKQFPPSQIPNPTNAIGYPPGFSRGFKIQIPINFTMRPIHVPGKQPHLRKAWFFDVWQYVGEKKSNWIGWMARTFHDKEFTQTSCAKFPAIVDERGWWGFIHVWQNMWPPRAKKKHRSFVILSFKNEARKPFGGRLPTLLTALCLLPFQPRKN